MLYNQNNVLLLSKKKLPFRAKFIYIYKYDKKCKFYTHNSHIRPVGTSQLRETFEIGERNTAKNDPKHRVPNQILNARR